MTPKQTPSAEEIAKVRAMVIFEDADLMAFNKPPGLSSQGARGGVNALEDLLAIFARSNGKRPHLVHRLDRDTSGVILAAKTKPAAAFLGKEIAARRVNKAYYALVSPSAPEPPTGRIEVALKRIEQGREVFMRTAEPGDPEAQAALTRYRTLASSAYGAWLEVRPETGRMHQIRAHFAHIQRPLVGDVRYGGALRLAGVSPSRMMLHAYQLEFRHPDGVMRRMQTEPPEDFKAVAQAAQLVIRPS